ncbi:hypothetical protein ACIF9R_12955 [Streptomyces sp. NPDC086080]|uniref:hypothetical protein n=1 Tax=Streptomyces sp. NPDC086080 TaxID=3365748 RepID=UPI0037D84205
MLVTRLRDAMLALGTAAAAPSPPEALVTDFTRAVADFDACRYASLALRLPRLIRGGHALSTSGDDTEQHALLAKSYLLATRMLVKMDEQQLGWMAADRVRQLAQSAGDVLAVAECARQLAVLARKAGGMTKRCRSRSPPLITRICEAPDAPGLRSAASWSRVRRTPLRAAAIGTGCGS